MALIAGVTAVRVRRVVVHGASMEPALLEGDRLLTVAAGTPRAGSIVAVHDPRCPAGPLLIKRVHAEGPEGLDVRGDNPAHSTDSRVFGPVPAALVAGRAVWRYGPAERAGRLGRGSPPDRQ